MPGVLPFGTDLKKLTIFTSRLPLNSAKTAATYSLLLAVGAEAGNFSLGKSVRRGLFFVRFGRRGVGVGDPCCESLGFSYPCILPRVRVRKMCYQKSA